MVPKAKNVCKLVLTDFEDNENFKVYANILYQDVK